MLPAPYAWRDPSYVANGHLTGLTRGFLQQTQLITVWRNHLLLAALPTTILPGYLQVRRILPVLPGTHAGANRLLRHHREAFIRRHRGAPSPQAMQW